MRHQINDLKAALCRSLHNVLRCTVSNIVIYRDAIIGSGIILVAIVALVSAGDVIAETVPNSTSDINSKSISKTSSESTLSTQLTSTDKIASTHDSHKHSHHAHSRVGFHGMVLVTDGADLFASHLPLYRAPHDFQMLYKVKSQYQSQIIAELASLKTVTILPAKFDLNILVNGQPLDIATQIFTGHFERGGKPWLLDNDFEFEKPVYKRALAELPAKKDRLMEFDAVAMGSNSAFYIHQIQTRPSFDLIVLGQSCEEPTSLKMPMFSASTLEQVEQNTLAQINQLDTLKNVLGFCKNQQILYFETRDFK